MKLMQAFILSVVASGVGLQVVDESVSVPVPSGSGEIRAEDQTAGIGELVTDPTACPMDLSFFGRTYLGYVDVYANWSSGIDVYFARGHYEAYCGSSDTWYYSAGRNWNAEGDPNKDDRGGLVQPLGNFAQLIIKARSSYSGSRWWIPYDFNYEDFYSVGENCRFQCNDRPGDYGDNGAKIRVFLYKA